MNKYYIQYHKAEELGLPNNRPSYKGNENGFSNKYKFFTKKKLVNKSIGHTCFLIVGIGKKGKNKEFYLWNKINIESVTFEDPFYWVEGNGYKFNNPIYLNDLKKFDDLKKSLANFSLGYTEITNLDFCKNLVEISKNYEEYLLSEENKKDEWDRINNARRLSKEERLQIISNSPVKPEKTTINITVFKRNIFVIAETLERAAGICEKCLMPAPFIRDKDKTEYLEVHHKIPLSENGDDTVENTIALCPNCHRHAHYGKNTYNKNH